jgi:hypothetical protein
MVASELLDVIRWEAVSPKEQAAAIFRPARGGPRDPKGVTGLRPADAAISPLDLYSYLKARFGVPNDIMMVARAPGLENLIQWGYALRSGGEVFRIHGTSGRVEFMGARLSPEDWRMLVGNLKQDFSRFGPQMREARGSLERWTLFINPFRRIQGVAPSAVEIQRRLGDILRDVLR